MPDTIDYVEYWVGGQKVDTVNIGDQVECRVVFTVASSGGTIKLVLQRLPGGASVPGGPWTRVPGTYYAGWSWGEGGPAGAYTINVDLYNDGNKVDSKSFPYTVGGVTTTPTPTTNIFGLSIPVLAAIGAAAAVAIIVVAAVATRKKH